MILTVFAAYSACKSLVMSTKRKSVVITIEKKLEPINTIEKGELLHIVAADLNVRMSTMI